MFSSARERRLWAFTLVVVVAIYSTLGLARTLSDELGRRELFDDIFFSAFLVLLAGIGAMAMRARPGGLELGVLLGVAAVWVMVFLRMAIPEERTHLIEYGLVAALIHEALAERVRRGRRVRFPAVLAFGATAAIGTIDELIQAVLPSRVFDVRDIGFNVLAAGLTIVAVAVLGRARRRRAQATAS